MDRHEGVRDGGMNMSGYFELTDTPDGGYRFSLHDGSGTLIAVSAKFPTKQAAAAGVAVTREIAGTGLIRDLSHGHKGKPLHRKIQPVRTVTDQSGATRFRHAITHGSHSR
jgi:uncharacterized protein YegP (UPF0339 family)